MVELTPVTRDFTQIINSQAEGFRRLVGLIQQDWNLNNEGTTPEFQARGMIQGLLELHETIQLHEPDALVFIEDSALPIAYLLKEFWGSLEARTQGPIYRPHLDSIDLTRDNKLHPITDRLRTNTLELSPTTSSILVIDDFIQEGTTMARAIKMVSRWYPEATIFASVLFRRGMPYWYGGENITGVEAVGKPSTRRNRQAQEEYDHFHALLGEVAQYAAELYVANGL